MQLMKVSELAKATRKSRNQIRWMFMKRNIKPAEQRANIYGGITNYYNLEDFKQ
jgi:hypothetical protein